MEASLRKRVTELVDAATRKDELATDPDLIRRLKELCRYAERDSGTILLFELLMQRLKDAHAQVRLHALRMADEFFMRSKVFRELLSTQVNSCLAMVIGHRADSPLPGPPHIAAQLQEAALAALEQWDEKFGAMYAQVRLAHNYLKDVLQYNFPEIRARAAAAEAEARSQQERAQALAQEKYDRLSLTFELALEELLAPVTELEAAFAVMQGCDAQPAPAAELASPEDDGNDWEDVQADGGVPAADAPTEGLSAYAHAPMPSHLLSSSSAPLVNTDPALLETATGLVKQLQTHSLPLVKEWLKFISKASAGEQGSLQSRRHNTITQQSIAARSRISDALAKYTSMAPDLEAATEASARAGHGDQPASADAGANAPGDAIAAEQPAQLDDQPSIEEAVFGASDDDKAGQSDSDSDSDLDDLIDMLNAGRKAKAKATSIRAPEAPVQGPAGASNLSSGVKAKLLAQAPAVPSGSHLAYWDSDKARALVNARGMELSNHWGPVDAHKELSDETIASFFSQRASYYVPPSREQAAQAKSGAEPAKSASQMPPQSTEASVPSQTKMAPKRAQDRAHNAAILGQLGDEDLARNVDADAKDSKGGRGARAGTKRPAPPIRARLAKKLLSAKGTNRALGEILHVEGERQREQDSQKW
ncbi:hypothetical protein WJX73_002923 [Symbiochloris irregularis]|uniref:UV-stimulated scaffold protein A n=1 Tax=Symbiochloris irregularis TaxID=706552 RepID=A0AAW1NKE7_9CHLO